MRIAMISFHSSPLDQPGVGDSGGMNVYVRRLGISLARMGVQCDVYTRRSSQALPDSIVVEPGFVVHHVDAGPMHPVAKEELIAYVGEFTDRVTELIYKGDGGSIDLVHANYWLSGIAGHALKHEFSVPLFTTFHTLEKAKEIGRSKKDDLDDPTVRILSEQRVMGCSDAILVSCEPEARWLRDLYGIPPTNIQTVPLGVDNAYFAPGAQRMARAASSLPPDGKIVLSVGRIQPLKGFPLALEAAMSALGGQDVRFILVGGPSGHEGQAEVHRLSELARELGVTDRVTFLPPQPHESLSSLYRASDVVIVPSRTESFGLVALEAAACGRPVVASRVGGLTELIDHGETGFLVSNRSVEGFAGPLEDLLKNRRRSLAMGNKARERVSSYTWRNSALRFLDLYEERAQVELLSCG